MSSELSLLLNHPFEWWHLSCSKQTGEIQKASFFEYWMNWAYACFSEAPASLNERVTKILETAYVDEVTKGQIERIKEVAFRCQKAWFYRPQGSRVLSESTVVLNNGDINPRGMRSLDGRRPFFERAMQAVGAARYQRIFRSARGMFRENPVVDLNEIKETATPQKARLEPAAGCQITWIGHSTVLLQFEKMNILIDPSFSTLSPLFNRHVPPAIEFGKLPKIDAVFLTSGDPDHAEIEAFSREQPLVFCPKLMGEEIKKKGFVFAFEQDWWNQREISRAQTKIRVTAVPARQSLKNPLRDHHSLSEGFVIECMEGERVVKTIYFAGDSRYDETMLDQIKIKFPTIDLAFLPITVEENKASHMTPEEVLKAQTKLGAAKVIPTCWGSYRFFGETNLIDPMRQLDEKLNETMHQAQRAHVATDFKVGKTHTL